MPLYSRDQLNAMMDKTRREAIRAARVAAESAISGSTTVYVQQSRPDAAGPWMWWETDSDGDIVDLTINDGQP